MKSYQKTNHDKIFLWKVMKSYQKTNHYKIILVEDDEIILENKQKSESLNNLFADVIINLNTNGTDVPVSKAIKKMQKPP